MDESFHGFAIKAVAERTDVSVHVLRAWERRYGVPAPRRSAANRYRVYDEQDVDDVLWMKRQVQAGVAPALAGRLFREQRSNARLAHRGESSQLSGFRAALVRTLLDRDESAARRTLDEAFGLFAMEVVGLEIIQPVMIEIGDGWMRNQVTVWTEHFASNALRQKLAAVMNAQSAVHSGPPIVCACAPGEEHELGLLLFALAVRRRGWKVSYLGQGTPLSATGDNAGLTQGGWLAISITTVVGMARLLSRLNGGAARPGRKLLFGGRLLNVVPSLQGRMPGVYLGEDAEVAARNLDRVRVPKRFWSPDERMGQTARDLQVRRLNFAGQITARVMPRLPDLRESSYGAPDLGYATLFLIDLLACAVFFQAPELVDLHRDWLSTMLSARGVDDKICAPYWALVRSTLKRMLPDEEARLTVAMVERMAGG